MTFEIRPGRYVARIFYCELQHALAPLGNMMGWVFRDGPGEPWHFEYRMRYYVDDDLTANSKDRKSWFEATAKADATLESLLPGMRTLFETAGGGKFEAIIVDSDDPEVVMRRLEEGQPWVHRENVTKEQWDARQRRE